LIGSSHPPLEWRFTRLCHVLDLNSQSGEAMEIEAEAYQSSEAKGTAVEVDVSLRSAFAAGEHAIPIDRIMVAVDGVHGCVASRLTRIGRSCDVDDVMQDIRVAVWDGVAKGR
jgi:hypothetical protein